MRNRSQIAKRSAAVAAVLAGAALTPCVHAQYQRQHLPPHNEQGRGLTSGSQQAGLRSTLVIPPGPEKLLWSPPPTQDGLAILDRDKPPPRLIGLGIDDGTALLPWGDATGAGHTDAGGIGLPVSEVPSPGCGVVFLLAASAAAVRRRR